MNITIPDNWNQVTVNQFAQLSGLNVGDNLIELTSILSGAPVSEVEKYGSDVFSEVIKAIGWIFAMPDESSFKRAITIDGKEYFLMNPSELSIRQWTDLILLIKDPNKNLAQIAGILYGGDTETFGKAMVSDIYGVLVFFCHIESEHLRIMQNYLMNQIQTMGQEKQTKWMRFLAGMNSLTRWRRVSSAT